VRRARSTVGRSVWPRDFKSDTLALSMNATRFLPITSSMLRLKSDHVANSRAPDNIAETTAAAQTTPVFHQHDGVDHRLQQRSVWIRGALVGAPARSRCRQRSANLPACIAASKSVDAQSSSLVLTGQALHNSAFRTPNPACPANRRCAVGDVARNVGGRYCHALSLSGTFSSAVNTSQQLQ
jgi:hypothetical protein